MQRKTRLLPLALSMSALLAVVIFPVQRSSFAQAVATVAVEPPEGEVTADDVQRWLTSLTFEGFQHREVIVDRLSQAGGSAAIALVSHATEQNSPLRLQARYMLRRTFWELAPGVLGEADAASGERKQRLQETFRQMVALVPLDAHHYGGWQKQAIVYERLERWQQALETYMRWEPPTTFCATCTAEIAAEKTTGLLRCYRALGQRDRAMELCWSQIRADDGLGPGVSFALALVELHDEKQQLDQLADQLDVEAGRGVEVARTYLDMRQTLQAGRFDELLPHLSSHGNPHQFRIEDAGDRDWQARVVAEAFGQLGQQAVPILSRHLETRGRCEPWTIYALKLTGSPQAVGPVVACAVREDQHWLRAPVVIEMLQEHPAEATRQLIPLLDDPHHAHAAITFLGNYGTDEALEPLIHRMDGRGFAQRCYWALWRRTGETLGMLEWSQERLEREGQSRWLAWWTFERDRVEVKPLTWWRTPEAAPMLVEAQRSSVQLIAHSALQDLLALEHPVLRERLFESSSLAVAKVWLHFEPRPCMPVLIEYAGQGVGISDVHGHLHRLTGQNSIDDVTAWRNWWQQHGDDVELPIRDRWW